MIITTISKRILLAASILLVILIFTQEINAPTASAQSVKGYPQVEPTSWYVLPGQSLGWSGSNFAPNEQITISDSNGTVSTTNADKDGSFNYKDALTVPFNWQNGSHTFNIRGKTSSTTVTQTIYFGSFYPQIQPSSSWVGTNQPLTMSVTNFAPGEEIKLYLNNSVIASAKADKDGNATFSVTTPTITGPTTYIARGDLTGKDTRSATITVFIQPLRDDQSTESIKVMNGYPTMKGDLVNCDGNADLDPAHHTFDESDLDPMHHRGQNCSTGSAIGDALGK